MKPYAKKVVKAIRSRDKNAVILIGSPTWSQDVDLAAQDPLKGYKNLMYTLHFYAGTHGDYLRQKAQAALDMGLPLFVSEFGISDASGNGGLNKDESSALIKPSVKKTSGWKKKDLTPWGNWLLKQFR